MKNLANVIRVLFLALFIFLLANGKVTMWLALYGVSLLVAIFFGRVYCGYVCPMNTLMIPVENFSKKIKLQTEKTPVWLQSGNFAWIFIAVTLVVMLFSKKLLGINLPILPIWLGVSVLVTLRYTPAVFHNLICPFGTLQKTFGRLSVFTNKVNKDTCIGCRLCEKVCPSDAIAVSKANMKAEINKSICHQCTSCKEVCPNGSIKYRK